MSRFTKFGVVLVIAMLMTSVAPVFAQGGPVVFNSNQSDPTPRAFTEMVVGLWNENNPDSPVLLETVDHEGFKQALRAYLVAEPAPDVLTWFAGNRMNFFGQRDLLLDIGDVWEENGLTEQIGVGLQAASQVDGTYYFLPGWYYWWAVYYRPSLFEQAGIESEPETWEELLGACDALNEAGIIPITIGTKYRWTAAGWFDYLNMRINGPEFHIDLMLLQESYTDERVMAVFDAWNELFEHNCFIEDPAAYDWQNALEFMIQGDAAMYLIGDFVRDSYPDDQEDDLDFFQFPVINPDVPIGEDAPTDGWFIAANASNPEGAKDFLGFLGSGEVGALLFSELGRIPANATEVDLSAADRFQQEGIPMLQNADYIAQFYDRDTTPPMADAGMNAFMAFWDNPGDIATILEDLDAERVRIAAEETE